ncbi:hypothetical protein GGS23DRAFT_594671 [Durotheca rogersii]|uniref:uncharacterized protein n=1 Tax=Durotheca rogersii TaxID=419775 RepID=UPI00221E4690|nr:uncharacterized protein GGS23DRAFT_594671 [Durotheca rogersii]KAI5865121.1 hypothetical protein GGS23DRAFT_594671 [Durotheca rogersii]
MPPTPASSTEMKGQDHSRQLSTLQMSFELPPSAITPHLNSQSQGPAAKTSPGSPGSPSAKATTYPVQPSETVKSRRRSSAAQKETFALPPPPTRSRRIIQMKPRPQEELAEQGAPDKASSASSGKNTTGGAGSKKKQPSATSAAGRKIARKTAHSLIERRRRSKMNEEFAVLKGLIPACTGEMHKLAILQASIEYVRYLEDCISKLKSQHDDRAATENPTQFRLPPTNDNATYDMEDKEEDEEEGGPEDVEMTGSEAASAQTPARSHQSSISPALVAQDARGRRQSYSSASTEYRHYSYSGPSTASPAFGPQAYPQPVAPASTSHSALTSPVLRPQQEIDQEASAALLMLNVDRRGMAHGGPGRGMSVRDLLSS